MPGPDLVIATIPGVQQFITDSRSTADAHAASRIVSELTAAMRQAVVFYDRVTRRSATVEPPLLAGCAVTAPISDAPSG